MVYLMCVFIIGVPVLCAEFVMGRGTHKNVRGAFKQLHSSRLWHFCSYTANLSLLYRGTTYGWNAQLAASYTGTRLAIVSPFKDADQWDKGTFGLDLSAEKRFPCGLSIFLKANNLTDTKRERYIKTVNESNLQYEGQKTDRTVVGTYHYGRTLLIGIRYSL